MACGFIPTDDVKCDFCLIPGKKRCKYRIELTQQLCDACATENESSIKDRNGKSTISCKNHMNREAKVFCESHDVWICHECAFNLHKVSCETKAGSEEIARRKEVLQNLVERGDAKKEELRGYVKNVTRKIDLAQEHLESIHSKIVAFREEEITRVNNERDSIAAKINWEFNERIDRLNQEREQRLRDNQLNANAMRTAIREGEQELYGELSRIKSDLVKKKEELESTFNLMATALEDLMESTNTMVSAEERVSNDFHMIERALKEELEMEVCVDGLQEVVSTAENVSFVREEGILGGGLKRPRKAKAFTCFAHLWH